MAAAYADETIAYCVKHGLADPEHRARFTQGALPAQSGDPQRGIELMGNAIVAADAALASRRIAYNRGPVRYSLLREW
jgi:hypothetical protein